MLVQSLRVASRAALLFVVAALPAAGQNVVGRVVGDPDPEPIAGAVVLLIDEHGKTVRGVLTNASGRFVLPAPGPGSYRLRAEMIGRRTLETHAFEVGPAPVVVDLALTSLPIQLEELRVRAASRCETGDDRGELTLQVWEEIKKALRAETVARELAVYEFEIRHTQRHYDAQTSQLVTSEVRQGKAVSFNPFRTLPPAELAANGYSKEIGEDIVIYGPNSDVFLSDGFQDTHCFSIKRDDDRLGLVFKPLEGRRVMDIEGVIWVDAASAELQLVEFKYKRIPYSLVRGEYSGFAEFQRLESGTWIISRWRLKTPAVVGEAEVVALEPVPAQLGTIEAEAAGGGAAAQR